ncbi:hypothetical protein SAMN05216548_12727 [Faunimonas pinastri]|uniref:Uncharacterized protein n=1 Tax=Faunimonas pinastri TaxID=1855383 RepID=A0A1H9QG72_9HYPH|nr:hypothetical protein [Faunimonas pinastri]SER58849.1 hypothetical protein SAMN05216548_12727 [Faunimonas pinastri]
MASFEEDTLAEFAAVNTVALTALKAIALLQPDSSAFLAQILEGGLKAMEQTNYWSIPADRREAFLENAKARYSDAIASIRVR